MPGVTFFDTADVYGDGRSEQLIGRFRAGGPTRRSWWRPRWAAGSTAGAGDLHRRQLPGLDRPQSGPTCGVDTLDLVQLHCPPTGGLLARRGLRRPGHAGRRGRDRRLRRHRGDLRRGADGDRPARRGQRADHPQRVPAQAAGARCCPPRSRPGSASSPGCRWPAACCPAGTTSSTTFAADDHRTYNRHGEAFDVGETFSGVPTSRSASRRPASWPRWCPPGCHCRGLRPALDRRPARGDRGDPGRPQRRAGPGQRRGRRAAPADRGSSSTPSAGLRRPRSASTCTTAGSGPP